MQKIQLAYQNNTRRHTGPVLGKTSNTQDSMPEDLPREKYSIGGVLQFRCLSYALH